MVTGANAIALGGALAAPPGPQVERGRKTIRPAPTWPPHRPSTLWNVLDTAARGAILTSVEVHRTAVSMQRAFSLRVPAIT